MSITVYTESNSHSLVMLCKANLCFSLTSYPAYTCRALFPKSNSVLPPGRLSFDSSAGAMEAFSVAVNAFSLCGLVDVLIRFGIETSSLYGSVRSAFRDIDGILNSLKTLTEILICVRTSAEQYEQSPFARDDGRQLPPQLHDVILECQRTLTELRLLAEASSRKADQGWLVQKFKAMQWATRNERVKDCCAKIEQQKATLKLLLSLIGR